MSSDVVGSDDAVGVELPTERVLPAFPCPICGVETKEDHLPGFRVCPTHAQYLVDYDKIREAHFALIHEKISLQGNAESAHAELARSREEVAALGLRLRSSN